MNCVVSQCLPMSMVCLMNDLIRNFTSCLAHTLTSYRMEKKDVIHEIRRELKDEN